MDISVSSVVEQLHVQSEMVLRRYADTATAADAMKTKHGNILNCCEGRSKTAVGFKWRFYQGPPIADCRNMFITRCQHVIISFNNQ
jgi:hypothetical protein